MNFVEGLSHGLDFGGNSDSFMESGSMIFSTLEDRIPFYSPGDSTFSAKVGGVRSLLECSWLRY